MKLSTLRPVGIVLALCVGAACDSGTKADAKADAKAGVVADAKADVKADAKVDVKADAKVDVPTPAVRLDAAVVLKPVAEVEAALGKKISLKAADLDLAAVVRLVVEGKLGGAAELELLLNAPGEASHRIDIDADGKLDYLQVVELRAGGDVTLELRAVPSSKLDASLAVLVGSVVTARAQAEGKLKVAASYGAAVEGGAEFKFSRDFAAEFSGEAVTLADASAGAFLAWSVQVGRPIYVSTHVATADVTLAADGGVQFGADAAVKLSAEQLAALRGALKIELGAPKVAVDVDSDVKAKVKGAAKGEGAVKASGGVKVGASSSGGVKVGGSAGSGVKVGGSAGVSIGGGASVGGKAGGGIKIGK
jgi:hypothetical protein